MIKLIAIDMDGTLLNEKKHIDKAQKEAIHEAVEAGIKIVLCTGRPLYGILPFYEELGLSELDSEGYVILNNGCSIHKTKDWELIDQVNFTSDDIDYLHKFSEGYDINFTLVNDYYYFNIGRKPTDELITDAGFVFSDITNISLKEAKPYVYEILPKGNNKGTGLKKLAKKLGIKQEEIMAIGDGNNDIEMFEYANYSVAMENSTELAKKAAKYQTDSNENDGVAKAIRKYALNNSN